jgi:hypothetical protein
MATWHIHSPLRHCYSSCALCTRAVGGQLVIGGHFWKVADQQSDNCGHGRSTDLDPNGVCQIRKGIAAYSLFDGELRAWDPLYAGKYSLVWALHVEGARLHTGGEFLTVNGVAQNYYARLSPTSP